jgi:hypothetical protein
VVKSCRGLEMHLLMLVLFVELSVPLCMAGSCIFLKSVCSLGVQVNTAWASNVSPTSPAYLSSLQGGRGCNITCPGSVNTTSGGLIHEGLMDVSHDPQFMRPCHTQRQSRNTRRHMRRPNDTIRVTTHPIKALRIVAVPNKKNSKKDVPARCDYV